MLDDERTGVLDLEKVVEFVGFEVDESDPQRRNSKSVGKEEVDEESGFYQGLGETLSPVEGSDEVLKDEGLARWSRKTRESRVVLDVEVLGY